MKVKIQNLSCKERKENMLNYSIMPLDENHIEEYCADIIEQQRNGVSTHALFMMTLQPECTPPLDKASEQCAIYDKYRERLDKAGAQHGVLVQATLGHIVVPRAPYPFQPSVSLLTGEESVITCCPADPEYRKYIKMQMKRVAQSKPSVVMIDDDVGLIYRWTKGCACPRHMAEFNRRAGTNMTLEQLRAHTQGSSEEDKRYTDIYVQVQRDELLDCVRAMREGLDEVDPTIQGVNSGIYTTSFCEFSGEVAEIFAGKGNPRIVRLNGGPFCQPTSKFFTSFMFRAALLRENIKNKVDVLLAETDTCPHNRYSTSAARMHAHFAASILEGAGGAKHWITRLGDGFEPDSGKAYRKILSKYQGFYEQLIEYYKQLRPFGCRLPLTLMQNYDLDPANRAKIGQYPGPWAACVLERFGLPLYFANDGDGAVFLDGFAVDGFSDEELKKFMSSMLVLSMDAAEKLCARGFADDIGVEVSEWDGAVIKGEIIEENCVAKQYEARCLTPCRDGVETLSWVYTNNSLENRNEHLFPGVTRITNTQGGETIVFCGTPNMPYVYHTAFSMLNESRKKQLIKILSRKNLIPLYYPEDCEVYLRAGYLENGEIMAAFFNLGFDQLEDIPFVCDQKVTRVEILEPNGSRRECRFIVQDGVIRVDEPMNTLMPIVLFIQTDRKKQP